MISIKNKLKNIKFALISISFCLFVSCVNISAMEGNRINFIANVGGIGINQQNDDILKTEKQDKETLKRIRTNLVNKREEYDLLEQEIRYVEEDIQNMENIIKRKKEFDEIKKKDIRKDVKKL